MAENKDDDAVTLDKRTIDVLVANVIPTSKYFEVRFDHMQAPINDIKNEIKDFRGVVNQRFTQVDKRFDVFNLDLDKRFEDARAEMDRCFVDVKRDMDNRFEQVDKRFEQVDKRLEQIIASIDRLSDKFDSRDETQRSFTLRMFTIAISISIPGVLGAFLKSPGII